MKKSLIKKLYILGSSIFIFLFHLLFVFAKVKSFSGSESRRDGVSSINNPGITGNPPSVDGPSIYDSLKLGAMGLSRQAFDYALKGFNYLLSKGRLTNNQVISIADFSKTSDKKRLFILDLKNYKILFNTFVAHGKNSGKDFADKFSNAPESLESSPGFYVTKETYIGEKGYCLRLEGEEEGINDNALSRGIVMHAAEYVNSDLAQTRGYIGRSWGCPAVPVELHQAIINKIRNGTCLFLYTPNKDYISRSKILKDAA